MCSSVPYLCRCICILYMQYYTYIYVTHIYNIYMYTYYIVPVNMQRVQNDLISSWSEKWLSLNEKHPPRAQASQQQQQLPHQLPVNFDLSWAISVWGIQEFWNKHHTSWNRLKKNIGPVGTGSSGVLFSCVCIHQTYYIINTDQTGFPNKIKHTVPNSS